MSISRADLDDELKEILGQSDSGARTPAGTAGKVLLAIPLIWSLFQLWYASPLPFIFNFGVLNDTEAGRCIWHCDFPGIYCLPGAQVLTDTRCLA